MQINIINKVPVVTIPREIFSIFIFFLKNNNFELIDYIDSIKFPGKLEVIIQIPENQVLCIKKKIYIWDGANHPELKKVTELKISKGKFLAIVTISNIAYSIGTEQDNFLSALELGEIYEQPDRPITILNDQGEKVTRST